LKKLTLDTGPSLPPFLYDISPGYFGCLEAVSIMVDKAPSKLIAVFQAARGLQEFTIASSNGSPIRRGNMKPSALLLPWSQLTTLHFPNNFNIHPSEAHVILRQCSALVSCNIAIATDDDDNSEMFREPSPTVLPLLRRLQLKIYSKSCMQDFVFPGLIALEVEFPAISDPVGASSGEGDFRSFISHLCKLQSLHVSGMTTTAFLNLLQDVPSVTSITYLGICSLPDETLAMIANGSLLPRLESLTCKVFTLGQALVMLESRLNDIHTSTIQDATLEYEIHTEDGGRVETLRNAGLSIKTSLVQGLNARRRMRLIVDYM
jgi:hypothetical protein